MRFLFLSGCYAESHSSLGRKSRANVGGTKCPESLQVNHQVFRSAQPVSSSFCHSFIYQTFINFLLFSVSTIKACLRGALSFGGEEMSKETLDPGSGGTSSYLWGEGDTESFTEEGVHTLPTVQHQLFWGHSHQARIWGYRCLGKN